MKRDFASMSGSSTPLSLSDAGSFSNFGRGNGLTAMDSYQKMGTTSSSLAVLLQWEKKSGGLNDLSFRLREALMAEQLENSTSSESQKKELLKSIFNRGVLPEFIRISKELEILCGVDRPAEFYSSVLVPNAQSLKLKGLSDTIKVIPPTNYDLRKNYSEQEVCNAVNSILRARGTPKDKLAVSAMRLDVKNGDGISKINYQTKEAREAAAILIDKCEVFPGIFIAIHYTDFQTLLNVDEAPNMVVEKVASDGSSTSQSANITKLDLTNIAYHNDQIESILSNIQAELKETSRTSRSYARIGKS